MNICKNESESAALAKLEAELTRMTSERDRLRDVKWEGIHALEQRAEKAEADLAEERKRVKRLEAALKIAASRLIPGCDDIAIGEIEESLNPKTT